MLKRKQNGIFANYFQIFLLVRNVFVCFKTFQIASGFSKDKTKLLVGPKQIWKGTRTKPFGPNFSCTDRKRFVSIQNFVSKMNIFDLFWKKSSKMKAFDLERTFV
jgi:hypothetical protein